MKQSFDNSLCLQFAIENAINYDKCHSKTGVDKMACLLDKATVNIGALFSKQVEGRISTEVRRMAILHVSRFQAPASIAPSFAPWPLQQGPSERDKCSTIWEEPL